MIEGVAWSYFARNDLRFSIAKWGEPFKGNPAIYWEQYHKGSPDLADEIAAKAGFRSSELTGFTLFWQFTKKSWQMSVQRKNEKGWSISDVSEEQAKAVLSLLQTSGHPDGPMIVQADCPVEARRKALERVRAALAAWEAI